MLAEPDGTGKTLAAETLATRHGKAVTLAELSAVVSKHIGETEKNLDRAFGTASQVNTAILFDNTDLLFGNRAEVLDAHDRYANLEINFMFQKMESYEGVVVLTTNLGRHIDKAFLRRLQMFIEFQLPSADERRRGKPGSEHSFSNISVNCVLTPVCSGAAQAGLQPRKRQ